MWKLNLVFKSGKYLSVDDLKSINKKSFTDGSISKITNFEEFHLSKGERLTFVGSKIVVSSLSDDIEYVEIYQQ